MKDGSPPPPRGSDAGGGDEVSEVIYHLEAEFSHTVYCNADNSGSMWGVSEAARDAGL